MCKNELIQKIKKTNCLKSILDSNSIIYSIVEKRLSFIIPLHDSQNIALKEFCRQINVYDDADKFPGKFEEFNNQILIPNIEKCELTHLTDNFYVILKVVYDPFIRVIHNFLAQKSHSLTFREYVNLFNDKNIKEIVNKEDLLLAKFTFLMKRLFYLAH